MAKHYFHRSITEPFRAFHRVGMLVSLGLACLLFSCGGNLLEGISDDDSYEAKLEEGLMALDDEDYDKAVELFADLRSDYPSKQEVCVYLSNAYAGLTGIDTFNLLETIDDLQKTDDEGSIDMIGLLLGNAQGLIDQPTVDLKIDLLALAKDAIDTCIDSPDTDERVQAGLLGLGDAALLIARLVMAELGLDSIELTEAFLDAQFGGTTITIDGNDISNEDLQGLNNSLVDIADAVDALEELLGAGEENDLSESFDEFLNDLDPDHDGVDYGDIEQYLTTL